MVGPMWQRGSPGKVCRVRLSAVSVSAWNVVLGRRPSELRSMRGTVRTAGPVLLDVLTLPDQIAAPKAAAGQDSGLADFSKVRGMSFDDRGMRVLAG